MKHTAEGIIFDVMRYAIHDGPGIRTTVFLKGCPLKCTWCANPESQSRSPEISYLIERCLLCGRCEGVCPNQAVTVTDDSHKIDRTLCQACGLCAENCPAGALKLLGRKVKVDDLFEEIVSDRIFWERSGGGVTLSGGEPLMQPEFCKDLLKICHTNYISTAIETCLHVPSENLDAVLPFVDLLICDVKISDDAKHKSLIGVGNRRIKENLKYLVKNKQKGCLIRMPLIPGLNAANEDLQEIAGFLKSLDNNIHLEIMPYHRLGEPKYKRLGREYRLECQTPMESDLHWVKHIFEAEGIKLV